MVIERLLGRRPCRQERKASSKTATTSARSPQQTANVTVVKMSPTSAVSSARCGPAAPYTDKLGVFNSYNAGTVAHGEVKDELSAGQLVGYVSGSNMASCLGSLYYQQSGTLPAVGNYDAGDAAKAMTLADMKLNSFVRTLNEYQNISCAARHGPPMQRAKQRSARYQRDREAEKLREQDSHPDPQRPECDCGRKPHLLCFTLPSRHRSDTGGDGVATISARATMIPASGTKLDFSNGPVTITVTAENGSVQECRHNDGGQHRQRPDCATPVDRQRAICNLTSGNYSERFLLDVKDFKPEQDTWAFTRYDAEALYQFHTNFWAIPADPTATMTAKIGSIEGKIKACNDLSESSGQSPTTLFLQHPRFRCGVRRIPDPQGYAARGQHGPRSDLHLQYQYSPLAQERHICRAGCGAG